MKLREIENYGLKILNEKAKDGSMTVYSKFSETEKFNKNKRFYSRKIMSREVDRVQAKIASGQFLGQSDHGDSPQTFLKNVSHIVTKLEMIGNDGFATIKILDTDSGRNIQKIVKGGGRVGLSTKSTGTLAPNGHINDDLRLLSLDLVTDPSVEDATFNRENILEGIEFDEDNLDTQQVKSRIWSYYQEALQSGFRGSFDQWREKFPQIVEQAKEKKVVINEKKAPEIKEPVKYRTSWNEVVASGFRGTIQEYEEKFPDIKIIRPESPQKSIVEKTLKERAAIIFTGLMKDNPNSQLILEDIVKLLEKKEIATADQRLRKRAIFIVNASIAGSGSVPDKEMLLKMVEDEIEDLKKKRAEMRERNWQAYERLLG